MRAWGIGVLLLSKLGAEPDGVTAALVDQGIFSDLNPGVEVRLPAKLDRTALRATFDDAHRVLLLFEGEHPLKAYAVAPAAPAAAPGPLAALFPSLTPQARDELRAAVPNELAMDRPRAAFGKDTDRDGIPDRLDVLLGARKLVANHAKYTEGYFKIPYPAGDVPREVGVCSDTIVRAFRNAGLDLQKLVAEDVRAARAAYPFVKRPDTNIDHRRVKTLLRWFERHVPPVAATAPLRPGDVVFMDTFPSRPGPDHVGIISDRAGGSGHPLVINNWTVGYEEGEMDLLPFVPVTHRFRLP
jgi:uncharacterized protein YijF (DUF1287 family)